MATLKELLEQQRALDAQIADAHQTEAADAIAKVRALVADFGLTVDEVFNSKPTKAKNSAGSKVAAKYLDPLTGNSWTGRGKAPLWIADKDRSQHLIK
jgi:DNA-binding protein H-NS